MADAKFSIAKLNGENFYTWKFRMELLLIKEKLWDVIKKDKPDPVTDSWTQKDDEARAIIGLSIEDSQLNHVRKAKSAQEAWNNLRSYHEKSTLSNKVNLMRQICSLKLEDGDNLEKHINEMTTLFEKLAALGEEKLDDGWIVAMTLSSLPRKYDTLIMALETRPEGDLTVDLVHSKLLEEYKRQLNFDSGGPKDTVMKTSSTSKGNQRTKSDMSCFFCKKYGHMKKDCRRYKDWLKNKDKGKEKANQVCDDREFAFGVGNVEKGWIIDSGATCHIANNKDIFVELDHGVFESITVANGEVVQAKGKGTCVIKFLNDKNQESSARISNVLFIPTMEANLLSVKRLMDKGFVVSFKERTCKIKKNGQQVAVADMCSNLYRLRQTEKVYATAAVNHKENCIHYWHRIFGHRDPETVKRMSTGNFVEGMQLIDCGIVQTCNVCVQGKMARLPFPKKSESKTQSPLDLVHTDVCGPMQTPTVNGYRYFVTFIDDYSRFSVVYLLKNKSDVIEKLKEYVEMVKTKFSKKPKMFRSDRGGEYTGNKVLEYLKSEGIQFQYTAAYSPQQNAVAERKNRTLMEMARCMLIDAGLENLFWGESVMTANYIQNRLPTKAVPVTPFERWNERKPSIRHFRIFGSKVFMHIPDEKRRKLDKKAELMTFVGYDYHSKAYRLLDIASKKIVISRDVKFLEGKAQKHIEVRHCNRLKITGYGQGHNVEKKSANCEKGIKQQHNNISYFDVGIKPFEGATQETVDSLSLEHGSIIQEHDTSAEFLDATDDDDNDEECTELRRSARRNKGIPPLRLIGEINSVSNRIEEPKSMKEALSSNYKTKWKMAMKEEMESLLKNNTWELTELPLDRKAIGCKWIFKMKSDKDGKVCRFKARLVAQGYSQKYGSDYDQVFAPVVRQTTLRTLLSIAGKEGMIVQHLDAKTAFLNGELKEVIFMRQPPGFEEEGGEHLVCLLRKSLYGLKQAARSWNQAVHSALIEGKCKQSQADPCLYSKNENGIWCYILIYVDDLIIASKCKEKIDNIEHLLGQKFEMQNLGSIRHYLGLEVDRDRHGNFAISQMSYIKRIISDFGLKDSKISSIPLDPSYGKSSIQSELLLDNRDYQKLIGCLLYIAVNTRPDISASVSILSRKISQASREDWNELKRILKYLKGTADVKLFLSTKEVEEDIFYGYADANWAEDRNDRKSNSGYVFKVNGGVVSWASRKQNCVALSSTEAEFIALSEACQEAVWLKRLLRDLNQEVNQPSILYEDNQSCLKLIEEEKLSNRSKHIDTKLHFVKDYVDRKIVMCKYCPTDAMLADLLTKPLAASKMRDLRVRCGLRANEEEC